MDKRRFLFLLLAGILVSFGLGVGYKNEAGRDVIVDAPWKVEPGKSIPMLFEVHEGNDQPLAFYDIKIYDNSTGQLVEILTPYVLGLPTTGICDNFPYTTIDQHLWYTTYYLNPNVFSRDSLGNIYIKYEFDVIKNSSCENYSLILIPPHGGFTVNVPDQHFPKFSNWYCGDTHYHSSYTDTWYSIGYGEEGGPIGATFATADVIGLDWFFVTDHSNAFGGHDDIYYNKSWAEFKSECNSYDKCLIGEEINCGYNGTFNPGNHYLGYNITDHISDAFYDNMPNERNPTCSQVIDSVYRQNGFGYAAHPESSDTLWLIDLIFSKWKDYNLSFTGLEIWNGAISDENNKQDLDEGLAEWKNLLLGGRKVFISAGSDAHGEFQKSFGKEMTCCYAPSYSKDNIYTALKNGNCYLTNNGALKFEIQTSSSNYKIGETARVCIGIDDNFTIKIDYDVIDECDLTIWKGVVGASDESMFTNSHISDSGQLKFTEFNPYDNYYYRLECKNDTANKRLYTNPIWLRVVDCQFPKTITVCKSGSCDYTTIQPAVDYAGSDDSVMVTDKGVYNENVVIKNDGITLNCDGAALKGNGAYSSKGIFTNRSRVIIRDCNISNYAYGIVLDGNINNILIFNTASNNNVGIYLSSSSYNLILGNMLDSNLVYGIELSESDMNIIKANMINNTYWGMRLYYSLLNDFVSNTITNGSYGFRVDYSDDNVFIDNNISANYYGVWFAYSYNNNITSNIFCPSNKISDIARYMYNNFGDDNTCDKPGAWNDTGTIGCTHSCSGELSGDVNNDCTVNIFDLAAVGLCFGKSPIDSCGAADLNRDGVINIFDLATVGINFGGTC